MTKAQIYLNKLLKKGFYQLGIFIGSNPVLIIVTCLLTSFTLIFCGVYFQTPAHKDLIALYTPSNAPSITEYDVAKAFFKTIGNKYILQMAIMTHEPDENVLDKNYSDAVMDIQEYFYENFTKTRDEMAFKQLCGSSCDSNTVLPKIFALRNAGRKLTYPSMQTFGISLYMGEHFHSIKVGEDSELLSAASCSLYFKAAYANESEQDRLNRWELSVMKVTEDLDYPHSDVLKVYVYSNGIATHGIQQGGVSASKYFALSLFLLLVFTVISCTKPEAHLSKPWEGVAGVVNPLLSICAGFGILFLVGFSFIHLLVVVPFLIIAIGVDDCFVMVHAWRTTSPKLTPPERLAEALSDCGPAIALTSFTNFVSFAIGHFSLTQSVSIFCTFSSVCMLCDFVYQITFYSAILVLGGRREENKGNACLCCLKGNRAVKDERLQTESCYWKAIGSLRKLFSKFAGTYAKFLMTKRGRILAALFCIPYWTLSIYSTSQMECTLSSEKLFIRGSSLNEFLKWYRATTWLESMPMYIFVLNNQDLSKHENLKRILNMVDELENTSYSVGNSSTEFWLDEYLTFLNFFRSAELTPSDKEYNKANPTYSNKYLNDFFEMENQWLDMVYLNRSTENVEQFYLRTSFKNLSTWNDMNDLHHITRHIVNAYPEFQASIYQPLNSFYADQVDSIGPMTVQTVTITIACMGLLCLFLIPHLTSVFTSICCLVSINIGVYGLYQVWYIDLDPISMMTSLFSLGLSIDFVSHISYHFFRPENQNLDSLTRLHESLSSVGWPILQAGVSTVVSVSPLWFNRAYVTDVFAKTVLLVVFLGLIHGLFLLPVFLGCLPRQCLDFKSKVRIAPMPNNFNGPNDTKTGSFTSDNC